MLAKSDAVVAIMGSTGAGKSTFVKRVTGSKQVQVGHSLESMTSEVQSYSFLHKGTKMTIVDTPGFDDSHLSDRDILMKLLQWLKAAYTDGRKLSGIVYLHRIDLPRMQGSALRNFGMFKQLCGEEFSTNIVLGTTCWDLVTSEDGARRESQLKEKGGFWYSLIQKGSSVLRIPQSQDSCRDILLDIAHKSPVFLKSQDEMGRMGLNLDQVSAIKALDPELEEAKRQHAAAKARQEAEFRRRQQELERQKKAEIEAQKRRRAEEVRRQQRERERIREEIRQQELQRRKEMEEMEARMRRMRIEEQRQRRERQKEQEKKLTDIQFQNDYQLLYQARKYGTQSARLIVPWGIEICDNCFTLIENAPCVTCPVPSCGQFQFFDLCMTCKPKGGVYCPGGSSHWPLKEDTRPCRYSEGPAIGEKTCWNCSTPIGPLAIHCRKDGYYLCVGCVKNGKVCCTGEPMYIQRLRPKAGDYTYDSDAD